MWAKVLILVTLNPIFTTSQSCKEIPPFFSRLRHGADITKLDFLPLSLRGNDGFRSPVIDFTCISGIKRTLNGKEYDIPDQVWNVYTTPSGWLNSDVQIHKTSHSVKKAMSRNAGLGVTFKKGMFAASGSYEKLQDYLTNSSKYIEEVSSFTSGYKVHLLPGFLMEMGRVFKLVVERLPPTLNANTLDSYLQFIRMFGTHYLNEAKFGGLLRLVLATDKTYFQSNSESKVKAQAKAAFFNIIKVNGGGSSNTQTVDSRFTSATVKTIRYYGGNTNLLDDGGIRAWQPSVAGNPWLFGGILNEISSLISNYSKKKSMERTVEVYTDTAYLHELVRILKWQYTNGKWDNHRDILKGYEQQLQTLLQQKMPNHNAVITLGDQIENALVVPNWFKNTELCYDWYPDGDGGQCGGGAKRTLCAKVNSMTGYYRDDTDGRGGGCRMRWGIISRGYDDWFRNVKICYKWWPDGDGGQCGGGAKRLLCANINSYTSFYRDDTDGRGGGCRMQWMLSVPSNAPLWLKTSELCYEWYPDGDGGQCGGGARRRLCAPANSYTGTYRDDTDGRGGGCRMRWGIKLNV